MNFSKQEFIDLIEEMDISYISCDAHLSVPSNHRCTVDMRTGPIFPHPFTSVTFVEPSVMDLALRITLLS